MAKKLVVLANAGWSYKEKNSEGDKVRVRHKQGDTVEVSDAQATRLLSLEVGGRPLFELEKVEETSKQPASK